MTSPALWWNAWGRVWSCIGQTRNYEAHLLAFAGAWQMDDGRRMAARELASGYGALVFIAMRLVAGDL